MNKAHTPTSALETEKAQLVSRLPTKSDIYLPTEKIPLAEQVKGLKRVDSIYSSGLDRVYRPRLRALREHFKDKKRCFIIGNGPSLKKTDLTKLENEITFAVNGFFLKSDELSWKPSFYLVEDHLVAEDRAEQIMAFKGPIKLFPAYLGYCIDADDDCIFYNHRPRISYPDGFDFSTDAAEITYTGCTVVFSALQIAAYLGFEEIILIGVDADYDIPGDVKVSQSYGTSVLDMKSDDVNHFHPDYFGKGNRWHDPQVDKMIEAFGEAKRVTDDLGIQIFNATVGGKLEVFPRKNYDTLFNELTGQSAPKENEDPPPKVLLLDFNKTGGTTATGALTAKYFSRWPQNRFLQICVPGKDEFEVYDRQNHSGIRAQKYVENAIRQFSPDVILYRPVAEHLHFHEFAMQTIARSELPFIVWLMDDWPSRLSDQNPERASVMDADLKTLCTNAAACFSISDAMSGVFGSRYGARFTKFHNGIAKRNWPHIKKSKAGNTACTIRYAGGLAPDMGLESVRDFAHSVGQLNKSGYKVQFEIMTQRHWYSKYAQEFSGIDGVDISISDLSTKEYRAWLTQADLLLICYNFDENSVKYVKYSFANKLPECLATGTPIIAYGPDELATMDTLDKIDGAVRIRTRDDNEIARVLTPLITSPKKRVQLGKSAQAHAFLNFSMEKYRETFSQEIERASRLRPKPFVYHPATRRRNPIPKQNSKHQSTIGFFKKYVGSWKGVVGVTSAILMSVAIILISNTDSTLVKAGAMFLVVCSQLLLFLLISHLAAHLNKTVADLEKRRNN